MSGATASSTILHPSFEHEDTRRQKRRAGSDIKRGAIRLGGALGVYSFDRRSGSDLERLAGDDSVGFQVVPALEVRYCYTVPGCDLAEGIASFDLVGHRGGSSGFGA